jgi:hypothetical protein
LRFDPSFDIVKYSLETFIFIFFIFQQTAWCLPISKMILALIPYCHSSNLNKCLGCTLFSKFKEKYLIQRGQFNTLASWQARVSSHWIDFVQGSFFIKYIVIFVKSFSTSFNVERRLSFYNILLNLARSHETAKASFHKSS